MDDLDKRLLNIMQMDFPVEPRPYRVLGKQLGISEEEALCRVQKLVESGVVRKIGPTFDAGQLGYVSMLVAARIPPDRLEEVAGIVSGFTAVTHNYGRDFEYNLWFTLICASIKEVESIVTEMKALTGIEEFHLLPAERLFKVKVNFEL